MIFVSLTKKGWVTRSVICLCARRNCQRKMKLKPTVEMNAGQWRGRNGARDKVVELSRSIVEAVRGGTPWNAGALADFVEEMSRVIVRASLELEGNWVSKFVLPPGGDRCRAEIFTNPNMCQVSLVVSRRKHIYNRRF